MLPFLLSLLLVLGPAVPQETQDGPYSLTFHSIGMSGPKAGYSSFQATGYLNDQAFFHYDHKSGKAEPQGRWKQVDGMEDWEEVSKRQKSRGDFFLKNLEEIMDYYKDTGSHIMQEEISCKIRNDSYCGAFWKTAYDGQDYIEFNTEIPAWIPLHPVALKTKLKWETEGSVQAAKAYLEQECPQMLRNYLKYSKAFLDHQDAPSVSFTSQEGPGNIRTLKCMAYNFYPRPVSMYWTQADIPLETDEWGDIILREDGTYHSWVTVKVPSSDTGPYFCHVQHSSLAQPLTVPWNEGQESGAENAS